MTSRLLLLAGGLGCLGAAAGIGAIGPRARATGEGAALGGLRTMLVDAWFLRAEALRRAGRVDELPALYRRILEADPDSESAIDYLVDVEANDLRTLAPTPRARVAWWDEADALLTRALSKRPGSARLSYRAAQLRLGPASLDDAVVAEWKRRGTDVRLDAFRFLADAVEGTPSLGRAGRVHLDLFASFAPVLAAECLVAKRPVLDEVLARSRRLLRLRVADLSDFTFDAREGAPTAAEVLFGGLGLVETMRDLLGRDPPKAAEAGRVLDLYVAKVGRDAVVTTLEPLLPGR